MKARKSKCHQCGHRWWPKHSIRKKPFARCPKCGSFKIHESSVTKKGWRKARQKAEPMPVHLGYDDISYIIFPTMN